MPKKSFAIKKFDGGINYNTDHADIPDNQLIECRGFSINAKSGSLVLGGTNLVEKKMDFIENIGGIDPDTGLAYLGFTGAASMPYPDLTPQLNSGAITYSHDHTMLQCSGNILNFDNSNQNYSSYWTATVNNTTADLTDAAVGAAIVSDSASNATCNLTNTAKRDHINLLPGVQYVLEYSIESSTPTHINSIQLTALTGEDEIWMLPYSLNTHKGYHRAEVLQVLPTYSGNSHFNIKVTFHHADGAITFGPMKLSPYHTPTAKEHYYMYGTSNVAQKLAIYSDRHQVWHLGPDNLTSNTVTSADSLGVFTENAKYEYYKAGKFLRIVDSTLQNGSKYLSPHVIGYIQNKYNPDSGCEVSIDEWIHEPACIPRPKSYTYLVPSGSFGFSTSDYNYYWSKLHDSNGYGDAQIENATDCNWQIRQSALQAISTLAGKKIFAVKVDLYIHCLNSAFYASLTSGWPLSYPNMMDVAYIIRVGRSTSSSELTGFNNTTNTPVMFWELDGSQHSQVISTLIYLDEDEYDINDYGSSSSGDGSWGNGSTSNGNYLSITFDFGAEYGITNTSYGGLELEVQRIKMYAREDGADTPASADIQHLLYPSDHTSNAAIHSNVVIQQYWGSHSNAVGWSSPSTDYKWEFAASLVYDGNQEGLLSSSIDSVEVNGVPTIGEEVFQYEVPSGGDGNDAPALMINVLSHKGNNISKRLTGANVYVRNVEGTDNNDWYLGYELDFTKNEYKVINTGYTASLEHITETHAEGYEFVRANIPIANNTSPPLLITYPDNSGLLVDERTTTASYKTAATIGGRTWIGNLKFFTTTAGWDSGNEETRPDAMIPSLPGKHDIFPYSAIDVIVSRDGDEIIKLEAFADRILQFKRNILYIYNVAEIGEEFLEEEYEGKGIEFPHHACMTDEGVAFFNSNGVFLYDGEKIINLFEYTAKDEVLKTIPHDIWIKQFYSWEEDHTNLDYVYTYKMQDYVEWLQIGYSSKDRQIIISFSELRPPLARDWQFMDSALIYSFDSKSWAISGSVMGAVHVPTADNNSTDSRNNFITNYKGEMISVGKETLNVEPRSRVWNTSWQKDYLSDAGNIDIKRSGVFLTKAFDFGHPGVRKKIYKIYVRYRGDISNLTWKYYTDVDGLNTSSHAAVTSLSNSGANANVTNFVNNVRNYITGMGGTARSFNSTSLPASSGWTVGELKPNVSSQANNVKLFQILATTPNSNTDTHLYYSSDYEGLEIAEINIVYRVKNVK